MLELRELSCGYGAMRVVHGLSLSVGAGEIVALIGANGAGKTSTIRAIAGHIPPQAGSIVYQGADIGRWDPIRRVKAGIALAPEGRRLFKSLTVRENLVVGGYTRAKSGEAANIERVLALFPRLKERFDQPAGGLSGGEQQMVAIGRALMAEPKLLLIDEVSLGLMPKNVDICYEAIVRLKAEGLTIVLVEQNTERALAVADQVCVLESGRRVWHGPAAQARGNEELLGAYLGMH